MISALYLGLVLVNACSPRTTERQAFVGHPATSDFNTARITWGFVWAQTFHWNLEWVNYCAYGQCNGVLPIVRQTQVRKTNSKTPKVQPVCNPVTVHGSLVSSNGFDLIDLDRDSINMWSRKPTLSTMQAHIVNYATPITLSWSWNWGSLAGICLVVQILSGIFLGFHYNTDMPFESTLAIIRDVPGGMWTRIIHQNGASLFFFALYVHMWRTLRYGSSVRPRQWIWAIGVAIYVIAMAVAFLGYVLPWGQMSFWGATVITQLLGVVPIVGHDLVIWLWGGYFISNPTLNRFFSLHYMLPFAIVALVVVHIVALHTPSSSNPAQIPASAAKVDFTPYFTWKDVFGVYALGLLYVAIIAYFPSVYGYTSHPDNLIKANALVTPAHIVPEWYFLWVYAMLRSLPNKLGGVIAVAAAFIALMLCSLERHSNIAKWGLLLDVVVLTFIGEQHVTPFTTIVGQLGTIYFIAFPFLGLVRSGVTSRHYSGPGCSAVASDGYHLLGDVQFDFSAHAPRPCNGVACSGIGSDSYTTLWGECCCSVPCSTGFTGCRSGSLGSRLLKNHAFDTTSIFFLRIPLFEN
jgi:ubiquinol-cytochrome c reductase cytochrome b subunit